ncbi:MAG TPA: helix-turn-helix domain-containing protein [Candidatus Methylacidiphilales bacterium]|jgi:AraC-like DNA-binding protein|nr:helix-turn-helix domain-containing protein [Candidatus Methylacidiphilales bacterium]
MASSSTTADIALSMPYLNREESVNSPRYRWNCFDRGAAPFVILQWTLSGEGVYENRAGRRRVPKDHAFLAIVPERSTYYYPPEAREPWVFTWVNWYGAFACEIFRRFQAHFGPVLPLSSRGAAASALRRLLALAGEPAAAERSGVSLQSYAFALEWWREAAAPSGGSENRLARALQYCRQHFREPLGVKEIAHEAGMSREHFTRLFVEEMDQPPAAFLRQLRLNEAAALLRETELPLREVAMRSGFYSTRHLMRTFQRVHRLGPTEYRRRRTSTPTRSR